MQLRACLFARDTARKKKKKEEIQNMQRLYEREVNTNAIGRLELIIANWEVAYDPCKRQGELAPFSFLYLLSKEEVFRM